MIVEPVRVIVDDEGYGVPARRAEVDYKITSDIVFLRDDDWALGAPTKFEHVAYTMWKREWTHFARANDIGWKAISTYRNSK